MCTAGAQGQSLGNLNRNFELLGQSHFQCVCLVQNAFHRTQKEIKAIHGHVINFGRSCNVYSALRRLRGSRIPALPGSLRALYEEQHEDELDVGVGFRQPQPWGSSPVLPA